MKLIKITIRPEKLNDIKNALDAVNAPGMMVWEIEGHGKQKGRTEQFRGREFTLPFISKTVVEVVVNDSDVEKIVKAVVKTAGTGTIGDGKIFISTIDDVIRIRTNERGAVAIG